MMVFILFEFSFYFVCLSSCTLNIFLVPDINGDWCSWEPWGMCYPFREDNCGLGFQLKERACACPEQSGEGAPCFGPSTDDRYCEDEPCQRGEFEKLLTC